MKLITTITAIAAGRRKRAISITYLFTGRRRWTSPAFVRLTGKRSSPKWESSATAAPPCITHRRAGCAKIS